jgi:hypothetical protein
VSEYYERGRAVLTDATSLVFFLIGFLAAGAFGWPALRTAFELGAYDRGVAVFIGSILGGGLLAGLLGYGVGALSGRLWQALHHRRRLRRRETARVEADAPGTARAVEAPAEGNKRIPAPMTCRVGPLTPSNHAALSRRVGEGAMDRRYSETSTTETLTLAAWDGLQIAGVARLLSDGFGTLVITDFVVDPYYDRTDVEQRLINFALERVPKGGRLTRA